MDLFARTDPTLDPTVARAALELSEHMIVVTDPSGTIVYVNPMFTVVTGYRADEAIGGSPRLLRSGVQGADFYRRLWQTITDGHSWSGELVNRRKGGELYTDRMTITPLRSETGDITHFVAVKRDVSEHLAALTAGSPTGLAHLDGTGRLVYANDRLCHLLDASFEDLLGPSWLDRITHGRDTLTDALRGAASREDEQVCTVASEGRILRVHLAPLAVDEAASAGLIASFADITVEDQTQRKLRQRESYARSILDSLDTPTAVVDSDGVIRAINVAWHHNGSGTPAAVSWGVGADYRLVCQRSAAAGCDDARGVLEALDLVLGGRAEARAIEYRLLGGAPSWWELRITPLAADEGGAVLVHTDVTARHELEQLLRSEARSDPLTGLLNRAGLRERYELAASRSRRSGNPLTVLFADLDGFKPINDRYGHQVGDRALCTFARHLHEHTRATDAVARVGGDEFAVLCEDLAPGQGASLSGRLRHVRFEPAPGTDVELTASIGLVEVDADAPLDQVLVRADRQMYRTKKSRAGVVTDRSGP